MKRSIILHTVALVISITAVLIGFIVEDTPAQLSPPALAPAPPQQKPNPAFDTIYFDYNKADISPSSAKALDRNGKFLKDDPTIMVLILGHTDSSEKASLELSEKRALSAKKYIQDKFYIPDEKLMVEGCGSTKPVADNKTKEGRSRNRRVEFSVINLIPAVPPPPPKEKIEEKKNTTFFWNAWAEEGSTVKFKPAPHLKPKTEYSICIHLSNFTYKGKGVRYWEPTRSFADYINNKIDNKHISELKLTIILIPDSDYFEDLQTPVKTMILYLDKIRKYKASTQSGDNAFDILQKSETLPEFVFGSVDFAGIKTREKEGVGHIGVAIWDDGAPVEDLSLPFCVSSTGCGDGTSTVTPQEKQNPPNKSSSSPAAALHFFGLNSTKVVGVFWNREEPKIFRRWDMGTSPEEMKTFFLELIEKFNKPQPEEIWRKYGINFFNFIFPTKDLRDAFRGYVKKQVEKHLKDTPLGSNELPLLFVRFTEIKDGMPFILPLGMMTVDLEEKKLEMIGFHFRTEAPLKNPNYFDMSKCISRWVFSLPAKDQELKTYYEKIDAEVRKTWKAEAGQEFFEDLPTFETWLKKDMKDNNAAAIIIMSHHGHNTFADSTGEISSTSVRRDFTQPSLVILNGCGTMEPSSTDFIQQFNKRGIIAVIATSTSVDKEMAADFLESLGKEIEQLSNRGEKEITISELFYSTQIRLYSQYPDHKANVFRYTLLGDGNLKLCVPKKGGGHE